MSENIDYDLIVIGAGPGGYIAAIRGAQLGMKVAIVEKRETLGGVCLNEGCIPSKALLDSSARFFSAQNNFCQHGIEISPPKLNLATMQQRKENIVKKLADGVAYLMKKHEIKQHFGIAMLTKSEEDGRISVEVSPLGQMNLLNESDEPKQNENSSETIILKASKIILATGSEATPLQGIPFDRQVIVSAREALSFDTVPGHLIIAGGGYIGLELGSVWKRLGSQVTVIEALPQILPNMDRQVADALYRLLRKQGIKFKLATRITAVRRIGAKAIVQYNDGTESQETDCDCVLVAVGRKPLTTSLGLDELGIIFDEKGKIKVDENYRTSLDGIYAIGDLIAGPMLAHKASLEATVCVDRMNGRKLIVEYEIIPAVCYTSPEAASVGKTEEQLHEDGIQYKVGRSNFSASSRAHCMDATDGFVKILADASNGRILGVHILGAHASELIAEATSVMSFNGTLQDIALTCHAHPTISESLREAALDA